MLRSFLLSLLILEAYSATYTVSLRRLSQEPVISSQKAHSSSFKYNYNAAFIPGPKPGLLVRSQNITDPADPRSIGPSYLTFAPRLGNDPLRFGEITDASIAFQAEGEAEAYGVEDPRIVQVNQTGQFFMFYSAVQRDPVISRLSLATSRKPWDPASWVRWGPLFPEVGWSKSGALLIRPRPPHYLFWGDEELTLATTNDLLHYRNLGPFLSVRPTSFDSALVEAGPMPLPLSDGNYLFIYNSARHGFPSPRPDWDLEYNVGWVILDGKDPSRILQRSEVPLLTPVLPWEVGTTQGPLSLVPRVVFLEGWHADPSRPDTFTAYYGAADAVIGAARIEVTITP